MSENKQVKIGAVLSYVILLATNVVSLIYTPFLLRMLGQSEYGLYSLMSNFIVYLNLLDLGLGNAMIVFMSKSFVKDSEEVRAKHIGSFLKIYMVLGLLALIIGMICFFLINPIFSVNLTVAELSKAKIMFLILLVPMVLSFPLGVFNSIITISEKFVFQKLLYLIKTIAVPVIMVPLLLKGYKATTLVLVTSIITILTYIINYYYCKVNLKIKIIFGKIDKQIFKTIFNYSFFILLAMVVDKINSSVDYLLLGATCGTVAVSLYSIGAQFNTIYTSFSTSISSVLLPRVSKIVEEDKSDIEINKLFIKVGRIQYLILALIMTGFIFFGKAFIMKWAGDDYAISYYIALILMIPYTVPLIQNLGISILQAKNMHKFRTVCYTIIAVINFVMSIILIHFMGAIGASIGTAFAIILGNSIIINIYYAKKCNLKIKEFWLNILSISKGLIIPAIIGIILNVLLTNNTLIIIGIKIIVYTLVYLISMYFMGMNDYEKNIIKGIFRKFKNKKARG